MNTETECLGHLGGPRGLALACATCGQWHHVQAPAGLKVDQIWFTRNLLPRMRNGSYSPHRGLTAIHAAPYQDAWAECVRNNNAMISARYAQDLTYITAP